MTFDLDLCSTDLNINRGHLLMKDSWISIGVIYSWRTIYLPSLKLLGQNVLELSVAQSEVDWHDLWPTDLNINRDHLLIKDYLHVHVPTKFEASWAKHSWVIRCTRLRDTDILTDRHVQSNMHLLFQMGGGGGGGHKYGSEGLNYFGASIPLDG